MDQLPLRPTVGGSIPESEPPSRSGFWHLGLALALAIGAAVVLGLLGSLSRFGPACLAAMLLGKLIILKGALPQNPFGMSAWEFAGLVTVMDIWVGYVLVYQTDLLRRIPRLGPWLARLQEFGEFWIHRNPWVQRWAFLGVAMFVLIPITGTGAAGASVLARLMGLRARTTLLAIAAGAVFGCSLLATFAAPLRPRFEGLKDDLGFQIMSYAALTAIIAGFFWVGHRVNRAAQRYELDRRGPPSAS